MKRICLTVNNYSWLDLHSFFDDKSIFDYYVVGFEVAPNTGTEHIQAYVEFKEDKLFSQVKSLFKRAHIEEAREPRCVNALYCKKSGSFISYDPATPKIDIDSEHYWEDPELYSASFSLDI